MKVFLMCTTQSPQITHFVENLRQIAVCPSRGEVVNGGFGLLLDGSREAAKRATLMLNWDVSNGVRP